MKLRPPLAEALDLEPHPEGGWFRQTWASPVEVTLPDGRVRPTATLIYFFVPAGVRQRTRPSEVDALVSCLVSPCSDFEDFELG